MASERQSEANRRLKHSLISSTLVVLPEENRHEYDEVLRGFRESLQPEGGIEDALVLRLAQAHWRSLRSRCIETGMLNTSATLQRREARRLVEDCAQHLDLHHAIGVGFMVMPAERWQMYLRYDTTISRDFFRTLDTLTRLQRLRQHKTRSANNPPPDTTAPQPPPALVYTAAGGAQLSDSGIRSVSQNALPLPGANNLRAMNRARQQAERHGLTAGPHARDSAIEAPAAITLKEQTARTGRKEAAGAPAERGLLNRALRPWYFRDPRGHTRPGAWRYGPSHGGGRPAQP